MEGKHQINMKPKQAAKMSSLSAEMKQLEQQLRLHRIAMLRLKKTNPDLFRQFKKRGM